MRTWIRFISAGSVAVVLAAVAIIVSKAGDCHPATCHTFEPWSWWWLWFNCHTDHCAECGYGITQQILGALIVWAV